MPNLIVLSPCAPSNLAVSVTLRKRDFTWTIASQVREMLRIVDGAHFGPSDDADNRFANQTRGTSRTTALGPSISGRPRLRAKWLRGRAGRFGFVDREILRLRADHKHRTTRQSRDFFRHAAPEHLDDTGTAVGGHND